MPGIHRQDDLRNCGATTIATGQSTVSVEGKLISVQGDKNSHEEGALIAGRSDVTIGGIPIIVVGDTASQDSLCPSAGGNHCAPAASTGSTTVSFY
jgi:uncharacterized Zn-binding protein involved in type VI secretion